MSQEINRSTLLPSTNLSTNKLKVFAPADLPAGVTTESLIYSLLVQQSQLFESFENRISNLEMMVNDIRIDTSSIDNDINTSIKPNIEIIKTEMTGIESSGMIGSISNGVISSILITDPGSGYPNLIIHSSGFGFTYTLSFFNGKLTSITPINGGEGYTLNDIIHINMSNFTGIEANISISKITDGAITHIDIIDGGSGYPLLLIDGIVDNNFLYNLIFTNSTLTEIQIINGSNNHALSNTLTIEMESTPLNIATASIDLTLDGVISTILITDPGSGYHIAPDITIHSSGQNAIIAPNPIKGRIRSYDIINGGTGYMPGDIITAQHPIDTLYTSKEHLISLRNEENLWGINLVLEKATLTDTDYNGLLFGVISTNGFLFDIPYSKYPNILSGILTYDEYTAWDGITLTYQQYYDSLLAGKHKDQFGSWLNQLTKSI